MSFLDDYVPPTIPEPTQWNGDDTRTDDSLPPSAEEAMREQDWHDLESHARDFVKAYGGTAMLRCVSEALK